MRLNTAKQRKSACRVDMNNIILNAKQEDMFCSFSMGGGGGGGRGRNEIMNNYFIMYQKQKTLYVIIELFLHNLFMSGLVFMGRPQPKTPELIDISKKKI